MNKSVWTLAIFIVLSINVCNATGLFDEASYQSYVSDFSSHKIGQVLTVLIYESATASSRTGTDTDKSMSVGVAANNGNNQESANLGINSDFGGSGRETRSGEFVATMSVSIIDITETGQLIVRGNQVLEFNNEKQNIELEGTIRPEDVSPNNTIISTRIADAKIKFVGDGLLSDRARPGILTRFFNWLF